MVIECAVIRRLAAKEASGFIQGEVPLTRRCLSTGSRTGQ